MLLFGRKLTKAEKSKGIADTAHSSILPYLFCMLTVMESGATSLFV